MAIEIKYPDIRVRLSGTDGNVYAILGLVENAMRQADVAEAEREAFRNAAFDCDSYDAVLQLIVQTVNVC